MTEQVEKTVGERFNSVLGVVPNLAATTSFGVLTLALVHEWAFYSVLGGQYQSLVSITDYFNSAVSWLPWFFIGFLIVSISRLFDPLRDVPHDVKADFYKNNRVRWVSDNLPLWLAFGLGLSGGILHLLVGDWYSLGFIQLLFIFVWGRVGIAIIDRPNLGVVWDRGLINLLLFIPMFLMSAYFSGMAEAAGFLHPKREPNAIGRLKNQYTERDWIVLRTLSSGLLIRDLTTSDRLRFIRWDDVASFETRMVQPNRNGLICRISGYTCRP